MRCLDYMKIFEILRLKNVVPDNMVPCTFKKVLRMLLVEITQDRSWI